MLLVALEHTGAFPHCCHPSSQPLILPRDTQGSHLFLLCSGWLRVALLHSKALGDAGMPGAKGLLQGWRLSQERGQCSLQLPQDRAGQEPCSTLPCHVAGTGTGAKCRWSRSSPRCCSWRLPWQGWLCLHPRRCVRTAVGLHPPLTEHACLYFIYFPKEANDSIKLFWRFGYLRSQCREISSVSVPRQPELAGACVPASHAASPRHFVGMKALHCPRVKR